jgi:hypothetical protein
LQFFELNRFHLTIHRPHYYVLFINISHIHRPAQRFFLPFPFKISLAFLLMNESLSILRNHTLVLVRLESRILQVHLFYVIVVVL